MRRRNRTRGWLIAAWLAVAAPAHAQLAQPSALAVDSVAAIDETVDADGNTTTGVTLDSLGSIDFGGGVQFITRPFLQRLGSGEWNAQIWLATMRYERPGPVGIRIEGGYIPSPIGMANLLLRPHLNPTISQPSSLFTSLPPPFFRAPRVVMLGALYPIGATITASGLHWDARAGVIDTSPLRARRVFADDSPPNPPRFTNVVVGGGVTPFVGLRVGASVAHGGWLKAGESPAVTSDENATVVTVETEFSFRYTKLLGEWVQDRLDMPGHTETAHGFFVQGQQTLAPRWFVAARVERMRAPILPAGVPTTIVQHLTGIEETVGYRLTQDLTVRVSHRAREGFGVDGFGHTAAVSLVFWRRWM